MASTYSTSLKLTLIGDGDQTGTWGQTTNANFGTLLEQAIVGQTTITMANADYTLTTLNGALDEARGAVLIITGNQNATFSVIVPAVPKLYIVTNNLSGSAIAYIKPSGGNTFQVPYSRTMYLYTNGTTFYALDYVTNAQNLVTGGTITTGAINCTSLTSSGGIIGTTGAFSGAITGTTIGGTTITAGTQFTGPGTGITGLPLTTGVTGTLPVANGGTGVVTSTGTGSVVLSTSPTLVTPLLGTPTSGNLANCTFPTLNQNTTGNAATATTATTAATVSTTVASGAVGTTQTAGTANTTIATTAFVAAAVAVLYPIGAIYTSTNGTNPNTLFGFGTWVQFAAGKFLMGNGNASYPIATSSGSADAVVVSHTHAVNIASDNQNQDHNHTLSVTTSGQSVSHNHSTLEPSGGTYQNAGGNFGNDYISAVYGSTANGTYVTGGASVDHSHTVNGTTSGTSVTHAHQVTGTTANASSGGSGTNANLPPYIVVYMWNRTA